jgi:DNA-directed RNA polymerase specialized sigma24 family protein
MTHGSVTRASFDDALRKGGAMVEDGRRPWWMDDPELVALRRRVLEEIENAQSEPVDDGPDAVVQDLWSGASTRELAGARDDLARARARYADAVRAARAVGLSWGQIGRLLGVPRQVLHRRFSRPDPDHFGGRPLA